MRPDLGNVKGVESVFLSLFRCHNLNLQPPGGMLASLDCIKEITSGMVRVCAFHPVSFFTGKILDALLGLEVILHPEVIALIVVPHEGVAAVSIHVPVGLGCAPVGEKNSDLMYRF